MQGSVRVSKRPARVKVRLSVSGLPSDATADVTDLMFQAGGTKTGWVPHISEMMPDRDAAPSSRLSESGDST